MNTFNSFLIFSVTITMLSCSSDKIEISKDFDHGSIGELEEVEPGYFRGPAKHWIKRDSIGDQYYWFYFKADNVKGKEVTFELTNLEGIYRGTKHLVYTDYTQPVFSYDKENWNRISNVKYNKEAKSFTFKQTFNRSSVWIAFAHPYSLSRYEDFITQLESKKHAGLQKITESVEGRDIHMATITDQGVPEQNKKHILFIALQHAGEDAGGYYMEGMINYLLSESPGAVKARRKFVFYMVPMMNPDGIYKGITRYNANMEDLNNVWIGNGNNEPEVEGIKDWVNRFYKNGNQLDLFIDVHNHTQKYRINLFFSTNDNMDDLAISVQPYWPVKFRSASFGNSARSFASEMNILGGTLELSQSKIGKYGEYLTINDYHKFGAGTVKGIMEYFFPDD